MIACSTQRQRGAGLELAGLRFPLVYQFSKQNLTLTITLYDVIESWTFVFKLNHQEFAGNRSILQVKLTEASYVRVQLSDSYPFVRTVVD